MRENEKDRKGIIDLVSYVDRDNIIMVEIGSYAGESAQLFADTGSFQKIICIDPWEIEDNGYGNTYFDIKSAEHRFDMVQAANADKIIKFKGTIDSFIQSDLFKEYEGKIDLVYIDGLHTYDGCMNDIRKTLDVIKPRLAVSGHDYADFPEYIRGVKKAVNETFREPDMTFCDTSWIKKL